MKGLTSNPCPEFSLSKIFKKDIGGFQVSMDDVVGMKVLQAVNDIDRQFAELGTDDPIRGLFNEVVLKISASHKASYYQHGLIWSYPQHSYLLEFVSVVLGVNLVIWGIYNKRRT